MRDAVSSRDLKDTYSWSLYLGYANMKDLHNFPNRSAIQAARDGDSSIAATNLDQTHC